MKKIKSLLILTLFVALLVPMKAQAADVAQGIYFSHAKLVGKLVAYNPDRGIFIVYGSVSVRDDLGWKTVEQNKFIRVTHSVDWVKEEIMKHLDKGVTLYGQYNAYGSEIEEMFRATRVEAAASYPEPVPGWVGFGKTIRTFNAAKFNIKNVTDFVDVLAASRDAMAGSDVEELGKEYIIDQDGAIEAAETVRYPKSEGEREQRARMVNWWNSHWNFKWFVEKDNNIYNEIKRSVGGSTFYIGQLGYANNYLVEVPVIRPDIESFMATAPTGGGFEEEAGRAVFFAEISAKKVGHKIVKLTASGPLFESPKQLVYGIKNNSVKPQTWRLEGWEPQRAKLLNGKRCWVSGKRVLDYEIDPQTGERKLVDYYFEINKTLTVKEFNSMLDLQRELIGQGGF